MENENENIKEFLKLSLDDQEKLIEIWHTYTTYQLTTLTESDIVDFVEKSSDEQSKIIDICNHYSYYQLREIWNREIIFTDEIEEQETSILNPENLYDLQKAEIAVKLYEKLNLQQLEKLIKNV